ncbi:MAG TPA: S1C family serine protease [Anaerolineaceae bacterium]|nr:S1C family serine protease [Anaerolineaceae bacterium]
MKRILIPSVLLILALITTACTPSATIETSTLPSEPSSTPSLEPSSTPLPEPTKPLGLVDSLDGVQDATIQIVAEGTFVDSQLGTLYNSAGSGSGFFIDPSGIAVTNNHVVTGAALLQVWVAGEEKPRNARILGVSECWDLAVIDVEGEGYSYLDWYTGEIKPGMDVYTAGFPLGDPEYTLTKGIISKANANGETSWASLDAVIEHDARIRGGNSGGPLVTSDGKVVGINFAGIESTDQNFAILGSRAQPVIERLSEGQDVESIGINGQAVITEDGSLSGIWVSSVKSGSPADKTGIQAGDILTSMEGLLLATDGTMADYCDILRTHNPDDTIAIEVLRYASEEYLEGQLNGRELETSFSFAAELGGEVEGEEGETITNYDEYVLVQDDYGAIQVSVPAAWSEIDGSAWVDSGDIIGASITAAASLDNFNASYSEPGVFFGATDDIAELGGYIQLLDVYRDWAREDDCTFEYREDYEDPAFEGAFDVFSNCLDSEGVLVILSAKPHSSTSPLVLVLVQIMSDADLDALDEILNTFDVIGPLP